MLRCPTCDASLASTTTSGLTVDTCAACGGVWFDRGELEAHLAEPTAERALPTPAASPPRGPAYRKCPHCAELMTPRNWERYSGVVLDLCTAHGVWVDGGELERLHRWMDSPRREHLDEREAERAQAERRHASLGTDMSARAEQNVVRTRWAFTAEIIRELVALFGR